MRTVPKKCCSVHICPYFFVVSSICSTNRHHAIVLFEDSYPPSLSSKKNCWGACSARGGTCGTIRACYAPSRFNKAFFLCYFSFLACRFWVILANIVCRNGWEISQWRVKEVQRVIKIGWVVLVLVRMHGGDSGFRWCRYCTKYLSRGWRFTALGGQIWKKSALPRATLIQLTRKYQAWRGGLSAYRWNILRNVNKFCSYPSTFILCINASGIVLKMHAKEMLCSEPTSTFQPNQGHSKVNIFTQPVLLKCMQRFFMKTIHWELGSWFSSGVVIFCWRWIQNVWKRGARTCLFCVTCWYGDNSCDGGIWHGGGATVSSFSELVEIAWALAFSPRV